MRNDNKFTSTRTNDGILMTLVGPAVKGIVVVGFGVTYSGVYVAGHHEGDYYPAQKQPEIEIGAPPGSSTPLRFMGAAAYGSTVTASVTHSFSLPSIERYIERK